MEEKRKEKYLQTRYKRELERFLNRLVNFSRQEEGDKAAFDSYFDAIRKKLDAVEKTPLYNDFYDRLEKFVTMAEKLRHREVDGEEARQAVLREANQIRKSRRVKSYSRKEKKGPRADEF